MLPSGSLRVIDRDTGSVVLIGQFLGTEDQLSSGVTAMLATNTITGVDGWLGCYSIALLTAHGVTLCADPVGQFPLFAGNKGDEIYFGSSASDIATHIGARLDPIALTAAMICPDGFDLTRRSSMFLGVRRVEEGHLITVDARGIADREFRTLEQHPPISPRHAAVQFRSALCDAVTARATAPGRLTADFSGGLDSTSLALLAVPHTAELPVLTYRNATPPVADDIEHARRHARADPRLRPHIVQATPQDLPYQDRDLIGDEPHGSYLAMGAMRARLARAAELGSTLHLVGEGGDVVADAPPAYLADLARHGELARLWRHSVAWARLRDRAPLALFRRAVRVGGTSRRMALHALARSLESGRPPGAIRWEEDAIGYWPRPQADWLTRPARNRLAAHARQVADELPAGDGLGVGDVVTLGWLRQQALTQRAVREVGVEFGIAAHAPFLDTEVVRACLSLAACRRADPTVAKPLLRAALTGLVPEPVLARRTKGDYTKDAYQGVRRAAGELRRLLAEPALADHRLIEPGPVREALAGAIEGMPTPWGTLNQVLAAELWLRHREHGGPV